ncbi:hypothetical protein DICVIV_06647 [Dictyocaulus viviparus]|uniref:Uncharacterized protein n=1 Tax=Dictyocaulus viviparus TaxID=29172 RepID=A0A0D8XY60_DICVI|nr:hypothetical protein DICVIV_06647 [Dictyocaulus viviparus]
MSDVNILPLRNRYPSKYSCLPRVTRNCPEDHKCVPSSREGMHICCRAKPNRVSALSAENQSSSNQSQSSTTETLLRMSEWVAVMNSIKVCAPFRKSAVSICCHSFTTLCGPGSTVEMDGLLARDCSNVPCSVGFECSLTPFGDRVCCSLAECSNGQRARAVCAGGCRNDEICEVIQQQRWCCPIVKTITRKCPDNRVSNGAICSPSSPICDDGYECEESFDQEGYLCCQNGQLSTTTLSSWVKTFTNDQTMAATSSTNDPIISVRLHKCHNGANPLMIDGEYLKCPELGAPCPKAGYTCQFGDGGLYCCPLNVIDILEASTVSIFTPPTESSENCRECVPEQPPAPKCPFAFREARSQTSDEFKTCIGLLDFS